MKLQDLKDRSWNEQSKMIESCNKIAFYDAIKNPENFAGKLIAFRGNYAGFSTEGVCIRIFEYISQKEKWLVSDIDLSDMFGESFDHLFNRHDLELNFANFCASSGFILEK